MENKNKELEELDKESKLFEVKNSAYQNDIARKLSEGNLGNEIKEALRNPIKIKRSMVVKDKIKKFIDLILEVL
jgi:hypothetical protein